MLKIIQSSDKNFELTNNQGTFLGKLVYENWANSKASITTQYGEFYDLTTKGFWSTHVEVATGGEVYAELRHNWRGHAIINILETEIEKDFLLMEKGFWKNYYILVDRHEKEVLQLIPESKWFNNLNYNIQIAAGYENIANEMMILIATFCANAIRARKQAATVSAAA